MDADRDTSATGEEDAATDPNADRTAIVRELYDRIPYHRAHDVEVVRVTRGRAETRWPFDESLEGNPDLGVLHGGVVSSLVDLTGAAVFVGECGDYTPTVDLRVNYLSAAGKHPLAATAAVERSGSDIGVSRVEVESDGAVCATGTGVYKLSHE